MQGWNDHIEVHKGQKEKTAFLYGLGNGLPAPHKISDQLDSNTSFMFTSLDEITYIEKDWTPKVRTIFWFQLNM